MKQTNLNTFDVIVVGGGHAGCEAAYAASRLGANTLLLTINMDHIAQMSCNPAIGGIAKGHVVREIDALGGAQGVVTDASSIQFRMLNRAKGPAVWSPRAQCDKVSFQRSMKFLLEQLEHLDIKQALAESFIIRDGAIAGVVTNFGEEFFGTSIVLTTGTFLAGKLHYGLNSYPGGRAGDPSADKLAESISVQLGLRMGRLKTGTPPRILAKTIDFTSMERQGSESFEDNFSFFPEVGEAGVAVHKKDMPCYMVYTTDATVDLVRQNLDQAPMFQGNIEGVGTRYCPSFEDKVVRFPHHERHLLYLEPEGECTGEYYINGISTSLPPVIQSEMIRSVPGMENAKISRYAYAIEYDFVFPDQIERTLAVKKHSNLFLAGQINGTSGYEEAAGQGVIAGLNAAKLAGGKQPLELGRQSSYIGVMIDDLVTKDITEPYRLFTSRAEYRLRLRQDNADMRLCEFAHQNGLLPEVKYKIFKEYADRYSAVEAICKKERHKGKLLWEHIRDLRCDYKSDILFDFSSTGLDLDLKVDRRIFRQLAINAHYEGYIKREESSIEKLQNLEKWAIPKDFDYHGIKGLRNEARMKLVKVAPTTLSQASRIDGVTPSEIALLQVHLKRVVK